MIIEPVDILASSLLSRLQRAEGLDSKGKTVAHLHPGLGAALGSALALVLEHEGKVEVDPDRQELEALLGAALVFTEKLQAIDPGECSAEVALRAQAIASRAKRPGLTSMSAAVSANAAFGCISGRLMTGRHLRGGILGALCGALRETVEVWLKTHDMDPDRARARFFASQP